MGVVSKRPAAAAVVLLAWAHVGWAQTADDVVERSLTATGGRAALGKLKSRSMIGTITLSTPAGAIPGSVEIFNAVPNKSRSVIKADLSAVGGGPMVMDQRFDGSTGYTLDTLQGNRDITGNQLDNLRNSTFPHPFLNYKEMGATVQLSGKAKVGDRDAFVLIFDPTSGSAIRWYIDAETYVPLQMVMKVDVPQIGQEVELTTELLDYKEVDGIKLPFRLKTTSAVQNYTITITTVEHNQRIDEALFSKPTTP